MTKNEWIVKIVDQLKEKHDCQIEGSGIEFDEAVEELKSSGLIERGRYGYWKKLTDKGKLWANSGKSYQDWLSNQNTPKFNIGHTIIGDVYDSRLNIENNRDKHTINNKQAQTKPPKSLLDWIVIILGIISAIITIWLFLK